MNTQPADLKDCAGQPPGVLLVEDETAAAMTLRDLLEELGCQVVGWATTASDAERLAAATPPDFVLMDIRIKGQRDGIDAAGELRERHGVPIVFVTGVADPDVLARASDFSPAALLLKPFTLASLRDVVMRVRGQA